MPRMSSTSGELWQRFQDNFHEFPTIGLSLDLSRMNFPDDFFEDMAAPMTRAFAAMEALEKGEIANPDENRMVGHYWLRNAALAPTVKLKEEIEAALAEVHDFSDEVHDGKVQGAAGPFKNLLVIGIGGSALGPQFVANALGCPQTDAMTPYFFDNTDPDGMDKVLAKLEGQLGRTLAVVISKSGGTKETRNGMLEAQAAYEAAGLDFAKHAVAVTGEGSKLDGVAESEGWLKRFPMWDWVGGRTSETANVGLLPAALQDLDIDRMLAGAFACDTVTRIPDIKENPAALLALMWYYAGNGKGEKDMVILPYKDRLELFSKYLQQLIMESLGKEKDLDGNVVNQGIAVYGNKGSTDQHAYVQQLREGVLNFFATFIEVLKDREGKSIDVEQDVTSGDYLNGFFQGTRKALYENGRESITITIDAVKPFSIGVLIALYERAVGLYASLVNINAYHQPGVEAGKVAAQAVIDLQLKVLGHLRGLKGEGATVDAIAEAIGAPDEAETIFKICQHLVANGRGVEKLAGDGPFGALYRIGA